MLKGMAVSEGFGIGRAVLMPELNLDYGAAQSGGVEQEQKRLREAMENLSDRLLVMARQVAVHAGQPEAEILLGHKALLQDPEFYKELDELLCFGYAAETAVDRVCQKYISVFRQSEDGFFRQRAADVWDIRQGLLTDLLQRTPFHEAALPAGTVLVAGELMPSVVARLGKGAVTGLIAEQGGYTSHGALLARAMGIPTVMAVPSALKKIKNGDLLIVDCEKEVVCVNPSTEELHAYRARQKQHDLEQEVLKTYRFLPTVTLNGVKKAVYGNIAKPEDAERILENGAEGIGLFRTEFYFMGQARMPTEDEQAQMYASVVKAMKGKPVIIRLLDTAGQKELSFLKAGILPRGLLNEPLLKTQIRAVLRASECGQVKLMIPMVRSAEEVRLVKKVVSELTASLRTEGKYILSMPVGAMIETAEAVENLEEIAGVSSFLAIGTNDLTGDLLGLERDRVHVYHSLNPKVTTAMEQIVMAGKKAKIPVLACGAAVSDARLIYHLLLWGIDIFSVSEEAILKTRKLISQFES